MTVSTADTTDWAAFFAREDIATALASTGDFPLSFLWAPLTQVANEATGDEQVLLLSLAGIASYLPRPDDWNTPYAPSIQGLDGRRSPIPSDLTEEEMSLLIEAAPSIPHSGLRARAFDVLAVRLTGKLKVEYAKRFIDALLGAPIVAATWYGGHETWGRALTIARRLGQPTRSRVGKLETSVRAIIRGRSEGYEAFRAAELLAKHHLAGDRANGIANRLVRLAGTEESDRRRTYLNGAARWYRLATDNELSAQIMVDVVRSFIAEAEKIIELDSNTFRAASLYEQALQSIRQIPKTERERLGVGDLPRTLARRIRELGAQGLGSMTPFESDPIDLSRAAQESSDRVKGKSIDDALMAFALLGDWFPIDRETLNAEQLIAENPFHTLFGSRHFASDGRTTHRSDSARGERVYGVDPAVWDDVVRSYGWHIDLFVKGALWPAYVQLSREHHLSMLEFSLITANTGIIPSDRVHQVARALYYGFNGDFSTAMQLLVPQIENLVRFHMLNAGQSMTTIDNGIENEIGLSALMERDEVEALLGREFAFEIRLLFCGPTGPNLRNAVAHGLLSDNEVSSSRALYAWWVGIRLTFVAFWNTMHDVEAAEAREPSQPGKRAAGDRSPTNDPATPSSGEK